MSFRKRPELDTTNPPGQIVNRPSHMEQPLVKSVQDYCDTEEMFSPVSSKWCDREGGHCYCEFRNLVCPHYFVSKE